uniref:integrase core domain-containing protein n=1 Tax=Acinetobacter ursingii TaxID=108980 RepID=UPI00125CD723
LDAKKQLNAYFEFYNLKRPHSSLDKMTPDEFYYDQLPQQNKVVNRTGFVGDFFI